MTIERPQKTETDITAVLAAGTNARIPRYGTTFECISVTTEGVVKIGLGQAADSGKFLRTGMGEKLEAADAFDFIDLINTAGTTQTVVLQTSSGTIIDNRLILAAGAIPVSIAGTVKTDDTGADGLTDVADQTLAAGASYTVAANANRRALLVYNFSASNTLRWGATPDATHGTPISPSSLQAIPVSATFKIFNAGVAPVTFSVEELTHS